MDYRYITDIDYCTCIHDIFGGGFNLVVWQITNIAILNVCHLCCKHGFLSIQHSLKISPIAFLERITKYLTHQ